MDKNFNKKRLRNKCAKACVGKKVLSLGRESWRSSETSYACERGLKHELINCESSPEFLSDKVFSRFTSHFSLRKAAFTLAEGATHVANWNNSRKIAFTLAEVLITLGIIGVVVAMTLPTLIENYKKQVLQNQFKEAYSILSQVNLQMQNDDISVYQEFVPISGEELSETEANRHIDLLAKYINGKICEEKYLKCTGGNKYKNLDGTAYAHIDADAFTKRTILLNNGMTLWRGGLKFEASKYYIDINGTGKGPNKLGYDLFRFYVDSNNKLLPEKELTYGVNKCSFTTQPSNGPSYLGFGCAYYALTDQNPDDKTKSYWKGFLK